MKKTQSKIKTIKFGKQPGAMYCFGCEDYMHDFRPEKVKMADKVLREKSHCVVCWSNKSRFLKQKIINNCYKSKMKTYCVKCRKDTDNIDPKMVRTKNNRLIMQSKCPACRIKKSRFVKEQEAKGLLSNLGINTPLSKIQLLNVLF